MPDGVRDHATGNALHITYYSPRRLLRYQCFQFYFLLCCKWYFLITLLEGDLLGKAWGTFPAIQQACFSLSNIPESSHIRFPTIQTNVFHISFHFHLFMLYFCQLVCPITKQCNSGAIELQVIDGTYSLAIEQNRSEIEPAAGCEHVQLGCEHSCTCCENLSQNVSKRYYPRSNVSGDHFAGELFF